jgi:hypothetical protein
MLKIQLREEAFKFGASGAPLIVDAHQYSLGSRVECGGSNRRRRGRE